MIEYIKGELTELTPATAVVEAAGVGYALNISLNTYSTIQGKKEVKLYVHENLVTGGRDDAYTLYGFASPGARALPTAHHRIGSGRQHGAHDTLGIVARGALQRHRLCRRAHAESRQGHRTEDRTAHHR